MNTFLSGSFEGPGVPHIAQRGDETVWTCQASFEQLASLIRFPKFWVLLLNDYVGAGERPITVLDNLVIRLQLQQGMVGPGAGDQATKESDREIDAESISIVQGISGTNVITVRPRLKKGLIYNELKALWDQIDKGYVDAVRDEVSGQGYGHMQISGKSDVSLVRGRKIAAFVLLAKEVDPDAAPEPFINRILRKRVRNLTVFKSGVNPGDPDQKLEYTDVDGVFHYFRANDGTFPDDPAKLKAIDLTIAVNIAKSEGTRTLTTEDDEPAPPVPACENMAGPIEGGEIVIDDIVIKDYA